MISPVSTNSLLPVRQTEASRRLPVAESRAEGELRGETPTTEGLAAAIMADGGLGFLQSRLQEKLEGVFTAAAEVNPDLAAAGPAAFFATGVDVSPEATADRIVGFALSLRGVYGHQNEGVGEEELRSGFEQEIRRGVREGFEHARGSLSNLDLLEGDIQNNVDLTWDLVQQKLDDFFHPEN